jgi:outer membrane protein OmpA-like peptidoglycan-associated protein
MQKFIIILTLLLLSGTSLSAQGWKLKRANDSMQSLDYMSAILLYQQVLQQEDNPDAKINLAEAYRKVNDTENAEYWYGQIVGLPEAKPLHRLYYGMMLQANGKCDLAKPWFLQYQKEVPDDARGRFLSTACDMQDELLNKNKGVYVISHLPVNSKFDDFAPALYNNTLVFASDREQGTAVKRTSTWTGNPFTQLLKSDFTLRGNDPGAFLYAPYEKFSKALNSKFHEAAVTFSPDQKAIYFTRNNFYGGRAGHGEDGLVKLKIYTADTDGKGDWNMKGGLPFNSDEYHTAHPSLSRDGKRLYFSSNRPGGFGGMDLYYSDLQGSTWGPPINLGPVVNTEGNELFPFADQSGRLYFASNGHIGLGGLDVFYTMPGDAQNWNLPVNLGAPINSNSDDSGIVLGPSGDWGFFASDREGGVGGDDIYGFQKSAVPVELLLADAQTQEPLGGVAVTNSLTGVTMLSSSDGKVAFDMRAADCANFSFSKKGYDAITKNACATQASGQLNTLKFSLQKQAAYAVQGIIFDMLNGLPAEGAQVFLLNDCGKPIPDAQVTTGDGRFRFKLDRECCYTIRAVKDGYIADINEDVCTRGVAKNTVLKHNLSLQPFRDSEGFAMAPSAGDVPRPSKALRYNNASGMYENADGTLATANLDGGLTVKEGVLYDEGKAVKPKPQEWERGSEGYVVNIYYDYDQASFKSESMGDLEKLWKTMMANPGIQVEIASHTDARGRTEYNQELSQRRADIVVDWLVQKGIDRARLTAKGYGESRPVNACDDSVICTEEEYRVNRRTEFTVTNQAPAMVPATAKSKPTTVEKPKAAPCTGCPF